MKYKSIELLDQLAKQIQEQICFVDSLKVLPHQILNRRPHEDSWNVIECLEHLNRYGNFYLPEIANRMATSKFDCTIEFKSGLLGNYLANSILPKEKTKRMKTFKKMDPIHAVLTSDAITIFLQQQNLLLGLLQQARLKNLTKICVKLSFSKWLRVRLGDILRFIVNHNTRHLVQIKNIIEIHTAN